MGDRSAGVPAGTVIVGASVAGVRTAQALRREGYRDPVVVVGDEPDLPYDRPPLSKQYLAGRYGPEQLRLITRDAAAAAGIELCLGSAAVALDAGARSVSLLDGRVLPFDRCVVATGASARTSPWDAVPGVHLLRGLRDAETLAAALGRHRSVAIVGGGFIGSEVAATASASGHEVVIIDPLPVPLARSVGEELGRRLVELHHRHGVITRFGVGVEAIGGDEGDLTVSMTDGSTIRAGLVVVGIGAVPNDSWLQGSGLLVDDGVVCDQYCRAVGNDSVFAVGDVCRWLHRRHGELTRVEHWTTAAESAACVAHNIVSDEPKAFEPVEYVWSDQYDVRLQVAGRPRLGSVAATLGDADSRPERMAVLYAGDDGELVGAAALNWPRALVECRRLLATGSDLDAALDVVGRMRVPAFG